MQLPTRRFFATRRLWLLLIAPTLLSAAFASAAVAPSAQDAHRVDPAGKLVAVQVINVHQGNPGQFAPPVGGTVTPAVNGVRGGEVPPKLRLVKTMDIGYGGTATAADFQASLSDGSTSTDVDWNTWIELEAGSYDANETGLAGYTASDWTGDCAADGTITLVPGDKKTCYITNSDTAATASATPTATPTASPTASATPPGEVKIIGRKLYVAYAGPYKGKLVGLSGWAITATLVGAESVELTTTTNGLGEYEFSQKDLGHMVFPGATIKVCEEDRAGWIHLTPECVTLTLPYPLPPAYTGVVVDFINAQDHS